MRRALMGTIAGWLVGAAGLLAQSPPPFPDDDRAPPRATQRSAVSPYGQNSHSTRDSSRDDVPAYEEQRVQTMYRPPVGRLFNSNGRGNATAADPAAAPPASSHAPQVLDGGGRCPNGTSLPCATNCTSPCRTHRLS